jgi:ribosomal protein S8E
MTVTYINNIQYQRIAMLTKGSVIKIPIPGLAVITLVMMK